MQQTRSAAEVLEALGGDPESESLHEELLEACAEEGALGSAEHVACILWFVANAPGNLWCTTPLTGVDPARFPDAYAAIRGAWMSRVDDPATSASVLVGAAHFVGPEEPELAQELLKRATRIEPHDAELWMHAGRLSLDPTARLAAFAEARRCGSTHPNLVAWMALAAVAAGDLTTAGTLGEELLDSTLRAWAVHGDKLLWSDDELFARALAETGGKHGARALTAAISTYAHEKHHAHTVLGLLAARRGNLDAACAHLRESGEIGSDPRLDSYGPCIELVRAVCVRERWEDAELFLRQWATRSPHEHVEEWLALVGRREVPGQDSACA